MLESSFLLGSSFLLETGLLFETSLVGVLLFDVVLLVFGEGIKLPEAGIFLDAGRLLGSQTSFGFGL